VTALAISTGSRYQYVSTQVSTKTVKVFRQVPELSYAEFVQLGVDSFPEIAREKAEAEAAEKARKQEALAKKEAAEKAEATRLQRLRAQEMAARKERTRLKGPEDFR
jgi:hypothetical protein